MKISSQQGIDRFIHFVILISLVLLFIPMFINFDSHHDGLILTTTLELKRAIENGGEWPFNQYGQFWAFPFVAVSFLVDNQHLFIALRVVTFFYYLLTAFFIGKISSRFLSGTYAKLPITLYLLAQPFALGLNSTFLPWPSAFCTLLVVFSLNLLTASYRTKRAYLISHLATGGLVLVILGSRLQVGALLIVSTIAILLIHRKYKEFSYYILGFGFCLITLESIMYARGWLINSLFDSIIFSSQYVSGDTSTYPFPKVTFILTSFFIFLLLLIYLLNKKYNLVFGLSNRLLALLIPFSLVLMLAASLASNLSFINWTTLLVRRLWISASLSILIFALLSFAISFVSQRKVFEENRYLNNLLIIYSLASITQIAPLFDQMHFWWGFSPFVILAIVTVKEHFISSSLLKSFSKSFFVTAGVVLTLLNIVGVINQISSTSAAVRSSISEGILTTSETDNKISDFLNNNLRPNSSVLSLCPNSNVFFSVKSTRSAIREFVLWSPTFNFDRYKSSFLNAEYDFIVTCPLLNPNEIGQVEVNRSINAVISRQRVSFVNSYLDNNNREWTIYSKR